MEDRLQREPQGWQPGESHFTLGLCWLPYNDYFAYSIQLTQVEVFSKRTTLSLAAKLFDSLGWLAPVIIRAKVMFQSTWLLGIDWDTLLPNDDGGESSKPSCLS